MNMPPWWKKCTLIVTYRKGTTWTPCTTNYKPLKRFWKSPAQEMGYQVIKLTETISLGKKTKRYPDNLLLPRVTKWGLPQTTRTPNSESRYGEPPNLIPAVKILIPPPWPPDHKTWNVAPDQLGPRCTYAPYFCSPANYIQAPVCTFHPFKALVMHPPIC